QNLPLYNLSTQKGVNSQLENIEELWQAALEKIEEKVSKPSYDTWLKNTEAVELNQTTLIVSAPNEFARDWLENQYTNVINEVLEEVTGSRLETKFIIPDPSPPAEEAKQTGQESTSPSNHND